MIFDRWNNSSATSIELFRHPIYVQFSESYYLSNTFSYCVNKKSHVASYRFHCHVKSQNCESRASKQLFIGRPIEKAKW